MFVADPGAVELAADLTFAPAPGCNEPGTLLTPGPEGWALAGCEALCCGVAWWRLNEGGGLAE